MRSGASYARYVSVIIVVIILVVGGVYAYSTTTSLQSQVSSLQSNQTSLQGLLSSLETELSSASTVQSVQSSTISSLQGQDSSLQGQDSSLQGQVSSLQSQVSTLQTQLSNANAVQLQQLNQISSLQSQLSTFSSEYNSLQGHATNLTLISNLQEETRWWNQVSVTIAANQCNKTSFTGITYPGYLEVDFISSSSTPLSAGLTWSAYGISYSPTVVPSAPGVTLFLLLPTSQATLSLCNAYFGQVTLIVTLIYHY